MRYLCAKFLAAFYFVKRRYLRRPSTHPHALCFQVASERARNPCREAQRLEAELQRIQRELPAVREKLASLDATMEALDARVAPNAGGVVKAQGRHGRRGSLKAFIHEQLQAAGSAGLNTMDLTLRTAAAFGVALPTKEHYSRYRSSIIFPVLRRGRDSGLLEELQTNRKGPKPQVWRWRGANAAPSLAELQEAQELREALELANKGG